MEFSFTFFVLLLIAVIKEGVGLYCFRCYNTEPGCAPDVDWRVQRWTWCSSNSDEMCVKVVEKKGTQEIITRECLSTLVDSGSFRDMPGLRRHGYCVDAQPMRNGAALPTDHKRQFCFCNDWNGCNGSGRLSAPAKMIALVSGLWFVVRLL